MNDSEGGPPQTDPLPFPLTGEDKLDPEQVPETVQGPPPNNKHYALRDHSRQRQPLRLMEVITRDRDSSGQTGCKGQSDVTELRTLNCHLPIRIIIASSYLLYACVNYNQSYSSPDSGFTLTNV